MCSNLPPPWTPRYQLKGRILLVLHHPEAGLTAVELSRVARRLTKAGFIANGKRTEKGERAYILMRTRYELEK